MGANSFHCVYPVIPQARDANDAAGPAAGAALVPGPDPTPDPAKANPSPDPTPVPSPTPQGARRPRPSLSLVPHLDLGPEAVPHPHQKGLGQDLRASPSLQQRMEVNRHRTQHVCNR